MPLPKGFEPIRASEMVERMLSYRGRGVYKLGGGAHFSAPHCYHETGNRFPGFADCTGSIACAGKWRRTVENTDYMVIDAYDPKGGRPQMRRFSPRRGQPLPGDLLVTGNLERSGDHAGMIVKVLPGFRRGARDWWKHLRVAHCSGYQQFADNPETVEPDVYGAVRVDDARRWRHNGYIIVANHVIYDGGSVLAEAVALGAAAAIVLAPGLLDRLAS